MAVYKRSYKPYEGRLTPSWSRFLVLSKYSLDELMKYKLLSNFLILCYLPVLIAGIVIYLHHNLDALQLIRVPVSDLIPINNEFFFSLMSLLSVAAFLVTAYAGPGLVSPDLSNNALALYLCRPLSRAEYVLGKMSVLLILLSIVTWIPGMLLFLFQAQLAGGAWLQDNAYIGMAIFVGSWIWMICLSLLALSLSAWVKWGLLATGLLFGIFFVATGFGEAINEVLRTKWGHLLSIGHLMGSVWLDLFRTETRGSVWSMFNLDMDQRIPAGTAWIALLVLCGICVLLLNRRLRAREVIR